MKAGLTGLTLVPQDPESILGEIGKIDTSHVDWDKLSFGQLEAAVEWVFYVGNDWIDDKGYWTHGEHWGGKTDQRNLAFIEFIDKMKKAQVRNSFTDTLLTQLPRIECRFDSSDIAKIEKLIHLYIVAESVSKFNIHMNALGSSRGEIFQAPREGFNHNGYTGHGASDASDRRDFKYNSIELADIRKMRRPW